jgi:Fe-only nitrogenase accessory protein AnfO
MPENVVKIAVVTDKGGNLSSIPDSERIIFFERHDHFWSETGAIDFSFAGVSGLCGMRKRLSEYIEALGPVKALLALGFPGVTRDVLTRNGYVLYETEIFEKGILEEIAEHLESGSLEEEEIPVAPYETVAGSGLFHLDLRKALNANPDLTTKKILRPFFQAVKFKELSFIYDHVPPWLPGELRAMGYKYQASEVKGGVMIRVFGDENICGQSQS